MRGSDLLHWLRALISLYGAEARIADLRGVK